MFNKLLEEKKVEKQLKKEQKIFSHISRIQL
jgi:hypothetical protein